MIVTVKLVPVRKRTHPAVTTTYFAKAVSYGRKMFVTWALVVDLIKIFSVITYAKDCRGIFYACKFFLQFHKKCILVCGI
jgi:hypothetical protein